MRDDPLAQGPLTAATRARNLVVLAVPILGSAIIDTAASLTNSVVVGRGLGTDGLAVVGVSLTVYQIVAQVAFAALAGFGILLAQRLGAGDAEGVTAVTRAGAAIGTAVAVLSAASLIGLAPLLTAPFGIPAALSDTAAGLVRLLAVAVALQVVSMFFTLLLYENRISHPTLISSIATAVINVAVTLALLPTLGVWAIAVGAIVSRLVSVAVLAIAARRLLVPIGRLTESGWENVRVQLRLSLPEVVNNGLDYLGNFVFVLIVSAGGVAAVAANQVSYGLYMGVFAAGMSLAIAVQVHIGHSLGAGAPREMTAYFRLGILIGAVAFLSVGVVMSALAPFISALIVPSNAETQELITSLLRLLVIAAPLMCIASITMSRLRAVGRTTSAAVINLVCTWVFQVGGALVATAVFGPDVLLCYVALITYLVARSVWATLAWKTAR